MRRSFIFNVIINCFQAQEPKDPCLSFPLWQRWRAVKVVLLVCSEPESAFGFGLFAPKISSVVGLRASDLGVETHGAQVFGLEGWCENCRWGSQLRNPSPTLIPTSRHLGPPTFPLSSLSCLKNPLASQWHLMMMNCWSVYNVRMEVTPLIQWRSYGGLWVVNSPDTAQEKSLWKQNF